MNWGGTSGWHISKSRRHRFLLNTAQGTIMHKNLSETYSSAGQWYTSHPIPRCLGIKGLSKRIRDDYHVSVYIEKKHSTAVTAQRFLYSYCVPGKDFSLHTSFTTCYRDSTKPVHILYTKERGKKRTDSEKKGFWKYVCWMSSQCRGTNNTQGLARSKINK